MNKPFLAIVISLLCSFMLEAQQGGLIVKKGDKGLYLDHEVRPKEGLYAIGRMYNVHPKFIASYNGFDINKGLSIGQFIKIPLTDTNFSQKPKKGIIPVYYTVGTSEGLMKVSNNNNKVTLASLRSWNNLKSDNLAAGTKLIIGFLQTSQPPPPDSPVTTTTAVTGEKEIPTVSAKEEVKQQPVAVQTQPVTQSAPPATSKVNTAETGTEKERATVVAEPVTKKAEANQETVIPGKEGEGFFKPYFQQQTRISPASKNESVTAGIFKTTSGWQDAKYYLLIDGVATGNIVKITNQENNRTVYAKVLGEMNGIRQNQGLGIRISNATAAALGITDAEKFVVRINY